jgi:hypothetical protein
MKNIQPKFIVVLTAIVVASVFRLLPHWPNFTPIATIALLGGSMISNRFLSFAVPVIAMVISDFLTIQSVCDCASDEYEQYGRHKFCKAEPANI